MVSQLYFVLLSGLLVVSACEQNASNGVTKHRGEGWSVWYPKNWKATVEGPALRLDKVDFPQAIFRIIPARETSKDAFFVSYREAADRLVGFPVTLSSTDEPMVYGNWFGTKIRGEGYVDGWPFVVSATAIKANGHVYLLQMVAPRKVSWAAHELLATLGRSLTFDEPETPAGSLPKPNGDCGTGTQCLELFNDTMRRITQGTR